MNREGTPASWSGATRRGGRLRDLSARRGVHHPRCGYRGRPEEEIPRPRSSPGPGETAAGDGFPRAAEAGSPAAPPEGRSLPGEGAADSAAWQACCRVVRYEGELDLEKAASFGVGLRIGTAGVPCPQLIVDLTDVTFMDGSPLHELCTAQARAVHRGGWVRVVYRHRAVALLFRASGLQDRFPRHATVEDARAGRSAPTTA